MTNWIVEVGNHFVTITVKKSIKELICDAPIEDQLGEFSVTRFDYNGA
jgi:hypothetical protein